MTRKAHIIAAITLPLALLAGCGSDDDDQPADGSDDPVQEEGSGDEVDPIAWFEENCPAEFATTTSDKYLAMTDGALSPIPDEIDPDIRQASLQYFQHNPETATMSAVGDYTGDDAVCIDMANRDVVEAVEEISGEELDFVKVNTPQHGEVYVRGFLGGGGRESVEGVAFDIEQNSLKMGVHPVTINTDLTPIDDAVSNPVDTQIDECKVTGVECGG